MRNINLILDDRKFSDVRSLAGRIIDDHAAYVKAKRAGGRDAVQTRVSRLLNQHGDSIGLMASVLGQKVGPQGGALLAMVARPDSLAGMAAQFLCGKAAGTHQEEEALRAKLRELDQLLGAMPEWGDDSLNELRQDSSLLDLLARVREVEESLREDIPVGPVGRALDFVGA